MSAGFTPGPWEYSAAGDGYHATVSPPVDGEAEIGPWFTAIFSCGDDDIETANARLAAAAPELYEALVALLRMNQITAAQGMTENDCLKIERMAEAALAKVQS